MVTNLEQPVTGININKILAQTIPTEPVSLEVEITGDTEIEVIFPTAGGVGDPPLESWYFTMDSDIPIFYSFEQNGTVDPPSPPTTKRHFCRSGLPVHTRIPHNKVYIRNRTPGTTGWVFFTFGR